jgi:hypothetical protein
MEDNVRSQKRSQKNKVARDASFLVRVLFRRNASFQGIVQWLETNKKRNFRSSLELVTLMQEAMEDAGVPEKDYTLRSWSIVQDGKEGEPEEVLSQSSLG